MKRLTKAEMAAFYEEELRRRDALIEELRTENKLLLATALKAGRERRR